MSQVRKSPNPDALNIIVDCLRSWSDSNQGRGVSINQIRKATGLGHELVKSRINMLVCQGKVVSQVGGSTGRPMLYRLVDP